METLKKAGAMLAHLELFHYMQDLRGLLQLAAHMEERNDRVTLISPQQISLMGKETLSEPNITTSKGASIAAPRAYEVLQKLKGHEAPEYAVTREELGALNARAVKDLESSDSLNAFAETLNKITRTKPQNTTSTTQESPTNAAKQATQESEKTATKKSPAAAGAGQTAK